LNFGTYDDIKQRIIDPYDENQIYTIFNCNNEYFGLLHHNKQLSGNTRLKIIKQISEKYYGSDKYKNSSWISKKMNEFLTSSLNKPLTH